MRQEKILHVANSITLTQACKHGIVAFFKEYWEVLAENGRLNTYILILLRTLRFNLSQDAIFMLRIIDIGNPTKKLQGLTYKFANAPLEQSPP